MESETVIRAYMLEVGDYFKLGPTQFLVCRIENGNIYYKRLSSWGGRDRQKYMGANSQERIILITNKTKQNEHQN